MAFLYRARQGRPEHGNRRARVPAALPNRGEGVDYSVKVAAKMLSGDPAISIGERQLFDFLLTRRFIYKEKGKRGYQPYQKHVDNGRLALKGGQEWIEPTTGERRKGTSQIRITFKGLLYFHGELGGQNSEYLLLERDSGDQLSAPTVPGPCPSGQECLRYGDPPRDAPTRP